MTPCPDDGNSKAKSFAKERGVPSRAADYPGALIHADNVGAMTPQEKGELLKRYVQAGTRLVLDVPGVYYRPAQLHEPPRWERIEGVRKTLGRS